MKKIFFIAILVLLGVSLTNFNNLQAQCISNVVITTSDVSCFGGNDGSITVEIENGTAPYYFELVLVTISGEFPLYDQGSVNSNIFTFSLEDGTAHPTFGIFSDNRYRVRVTSSNPAFPPGCNQVQIGNVSVGQPELLEVVAAPTSDCDASGSGSINLTVTGGTAPYTYTWSNGLPSQEDHINTLPAGTYSVEIEDANGCIVSLTDLVVTEFTIANAGADQTICDVTATLSGNLVNTGETGTWSSTNASISFGNISDPNTTVSGLIAGAANTLTWTVSDNNGVCADNSDDVIITVDEITLANAGADQDICIDNATLSANQPIGLEEGLWTVTSGTGTFADENAHNTTVTGLSAGANVFTWTITDASGVCPPTSDLVSINFTDLTIADAGADQTICDVTASLSGNTVNTGETGTWSSTNASISFGNISDPNTTVSGLIAGAANTLTWTVSDNNGVCADNSDDVIITVDEITLANAGADQDICIDNATLSANQPIGLEEGLWTVTSGTGVFTDASVHNTTVTGLSAGANVFTWTITDASGVCPPTSDLVSINFTDLSIADAGADQTICDVTATLSGNVVKTGETGTWSSTNGSVSFGNINDANTTVSGLIAGAANTLTWTVSDNNGVCADNSDDVIITVDEITLANAGADQDICLDNATLSANQALGTETGLWTVTSGTGVFTDASVHNTTVTGLSAGANVFTWTITDASGVCPPTSDLVSINFTDLTIADAGTDQTICDVTATLSGNIVKTGESGTWSSTNALITFADINDRNTTVNNLAAGANTLTWTVSDNNGVCADNSDDVIITVDEITLANAGADQDICIDNATLSANQAFGTETGLWTVTSGTGTFADENAHNTTVTGLSAGANVFTWTITDASGVCLPTSDLVSINFTDLTIADAGADQTICDVIATLSGNTLKTGETGTWSSTNGSVSFGTINDPNTTVSGLTAGAANTLTWTVSDNNGVCADNSDDVIITVDEITLANAGADQDICINNTTLSANQALGTETGLWTVTSGTGTFADENAHNTTVTGLSAGANVFTWTITDASGVCPATSDLVSINFTDLTIADAGVDQTICDVTATLSGNTLKTGETGTWSSTNGSVSFGNINDPNTTVSGLIAGAANTVTWTVSDNNGVCADNSDDVIITVDEITLANAGADQDICIDNTTLSANLALGTETGLWTVASGTGTFADENAHNTTVTGLSAGANVFTWTITDASGVCPATSDLVSINFTDLTIADAGADQTICDVTTSLSGNLLKTNETGTWSSTNALITFADVNDRNTTVNNLAAGANTLTWTVSDDNGVCASNADDVVINVGAITIDNIVAEDATCNGATDGTITVTASNGAPAYQYSLDGTTFQASNVFTGLAAGSYTITVQDANLCMITTTATITEPLALTAIANETNVSCTGIADGAIAVNASEGSAPYEYSLDGISYQGNNTFNGLSEGSYTVTVRDVNGCDFTFASTIGKDPIETASVDITSDVSEICAGGTVNFTATPDNGGSAPTYQWFINGIAEAGATDATFTSSTLNDGDDVTVEMTAGGTGIGCITGSPAMSGPITISVPGNLTASVSVTSDVSETCAGSPVVFTATPDNGGSAPTYQWFINGTAEAGATSASFTTTTLNDGDAVTVEMTAGGTGIDCITGSPAVSAPLVISVPANQPVSVTIDADFEVICAGATVNFIATPENGGSAPTYQWFINGIAEAGSTSATFASSTLNDGDAVTVEMTADGTGITCISGSPATSDPIVISVPGSLAASVTIAPNITDVCPGDAVIFTATPVNGGSAPTYQWYINGSAPAGETGETFTANGLNNGDEIFVEMAAGGTNAACVTGSPAESDPYTITISTTTLTASVDITSDFDEICAGSTVNFTATPENGGSAPTYQWFINGLAEAGATDATFASSNLSDGDDVTVEMTAGGTGIGCITGSPAMSSPITISVPGNLTASVSVTSDVSETCAGSPVVFTATPDNGGSEPTYQWFINGTAEAGTTSASFTTTTLNDGDAVTVEMTAGGTGIDCITGSPAVSAPSVISVPANQPVSVTIDADFEEICAGASVNFIATPENGGSAPTYQWFVNGVAEAGATNASFASSTLNDGDAVTVEMTAGGTGISCISGSPATADPIVISVPGSLVASVTIAPNITDVCPGDAVIFTAMPENGGSAPTYQWYFNGSAPVGETGETFTANGLTDGDVIFVEMTAGGTNTDCVTGSPVESDPYTITISTTTLTASVDITSDFAEICAGSPVNFTATPENGGSAPTYQWFINGIAEAGATDATFTSSTLNDGDDVTVEMTAGGTGIGCISGSPAMSGPITISVPGDLTASVTMTSDVSETCAGSPVVFTATPDNGGSAPTYQWFINGIAEAGATSASFTTTTLNDGDAVTVEMTAGGTGIDCITGSPAVSAPSVISVAANQPVSVTIDADFEEICAGSTVNFIATPENGGSAPTYQWFVNGVAEAGATNDTFASSTLNDGDVVTVEMTAGGTGISCISGSPATADPIVISVPGSLVASVSIAPNITEVCPGDAVIFTATPENGGSAPTYQWYFNGSAPVGETGETFTANGLTDGDEIFVEMTAGGTNTDCVTGSPVESDPYTITISTTTVTASVDITSDFEEICAGSTVNFTAAPENGGSAPTFQWFINGIAEAGATDATFTSSTLNDGDDVTVEMTAGGTGIGCISGSPAMSGPITISVPGNLTASVSVTSDVSEICAGSPVIFNATPDNGGSAPTYQWFINGIAEAGATSASFTTMTLNNGDAVTVEMTAGGTNIDCITDSPAVSTPLSITIGGQASEPIVDINDYDYCEGDVIADLEATGLDLKWYDDAALTNLVGTGSPFATNLDADIIGNFTFFVTQTSSGCGESNAVEITVSINATSPAPMANDTSVEVCQNDAIPTLSATGNTLLWYSDAALSTQVGSGIDYVPRASDLDMTTPGSTTFYVTQNIGCGESVATEVTVIVTSGSSVPVVVSQINVCQNTAAPTLTASGDNLLWYFDAALTNQIGSGSTYTPASSELDMATAGNTIFYVTQDTGCGESDPATITVNIIDSADPLCAGGGGGGCIIVTVDPTKGDCGMENGQIDFTVTGGSGNYFYEIMLEGLVVFSDNSPTFPNLATAAYTYKVYDLNNLSCFVEGEATVAPKGSIASALVESTEPVICFGENEGKVVLDIEGGIPPYEYSLDNAVTWNVFVSEISGLPAGRNEILIRDNNMDICYYPVVANISNLYDEIKIQAVSSDATCNVNDGSITINSISGGLAPYEVALQKDGEPLVFANYDSASPLLYQGVSKGYHDVVIRDTNGCTKTIEMLVDAPNLVVFSLTPIAPTCDNNGLDGKFLVNINPYDAAKNYQYAITKGEAPETFLPVTKNLFLIENLSAGSYEVYITTDGECINEQEEVISGGAAAVAFETETSDIKCFGDTGGVKLMNVTGAPGMNFIYSLMDEDGEETANGAINQNQALFGYSINGLARGQYVLQVSQSQPDVNCIINAPALTFSIAGPTSAVQYDSIEVVASLPDQPTGSIKIAEVEGGKAGYSAEIIDFDPRFLEQSGFPNGTFDLTPNLDGIHQDVTISDLYAGLYTIILTDGFGCEMEIIVDVDYDRSIFIPNIFTPNGDLYNETFYIRNLPDAGSSLVVTNRWGKIVYENKNYTNALSWNGDDLPDGVYYYKLLANNESFTGWVEIWRGKDKK